MTQDVMPTGVVWTHAGHAHLDELFASAIIDAYVTAVTEIKRVHEDELKPNMGDIVVDIGEKIGCRRGVWYLDHHQDKEIKCSACLVVKNLAKEALKDPYLQDMLKIVDGLDRNGIAGLNNLLQAEHMQYVRALIFMLNSSLDVFERDPLTAVKQISRTLGERKRFVESIEGVINKLRKNCVHKKVGNYKVLIVPHFEQCGIGKEFFEASQNMLQRESGIDVILGWNPRREFSSRRIYLPGNKKELSLEKVKDRKEVEFCHPKGFLVNVKKEVSLETCMNLIEEALT